MINKRFTKEENKSAEKELDCALNCLLLIELHLGKGNFADALMLLNDLQKSITSLKMLSEDKISKLQVISVMNRLSSVGIDPETIKRLIKKAE